MRSHTSKLVILTLFSVLLLTSVSAESNWEFEPYLGDFGPQNISENTNSVFLTDLKVDSIELRPDNIENFENPLPEEEQGDDYVEPYVLVEYQVLNESDSTPMTVNDTLTYNEQLETWYIEFETDYSEMENITFRANGTADGDIPDSEAEANNTLNINVGEYKPDLVDINLPYTIEDPIKAERLMKTDVQVTNTTGDIQDDASVEVYFHNLTDMEEKFQLQNYNDEEGYFFNAEVDTPTSTNSTYLMRIIAENESQGHYGSQSFVVETAPAIQGDTTVLGTSDNCETSEMVERCEVDTTLDAEFGITAANAEGVNATLFGTNLTSGEREIINQVEMGELSSEDFDTEEFVQYFESDVVIPDINTSEWEREVEVQFHSFNIDRSYNESFNIDLETFRIEDRSNPTALTGRTHEIRLRIGKYFSLSGYGPDRFESLSANLTGPGEEFYFDKSNLSYDDASNVFTAEILLDADAEEAAYSLETMAENIYGEEKQRSSRLTVEDIEQTFDAPTEIDLEYQGEGEYEESFEIENLLDSSMTVTTDPSSETIIIDEEFELDPNEQVTVDYTVNRTTNEDETVNLMMEDNSTGYFVDTNVNIVGADCAAILDDLCVETEEIDLEVDSPFEFTEPVDLSNSGDEELNINVSTEGNISEMVELDNSIQFNESYELGVDVMPFEPGFFNGSLVFEINDSQTSIPMSADVNIDEIERNMTVDPEEIDLGSLTDDETVTESFTVTNTGNIIIEDIEVEESQLEASSDQYTLTDGEETDIEVTIGNPANTDLIFSGVAAGQEVSATVDVSADIIEDVTRNIGDIENRISNLRPRVDDPNLESDLTEVETMVSQIESQWDSGDYEQAQATFDDAQSELDRIESDIDSQQTDETQQPQEPSNGDTDDGGLPIIPIVAILFVLGLVGAFVFYESYMPEEGDPLYGVMGE